MNVSKSVNDAELQMSSPEIDSLVKTIVIPPRPKTLVDLQAEMRQEDPNFGRVAGMISTCLLYTSPSPRDS